MESSYNTHFKRPSGTPLHRQRSLPPPRAFVEPLSPPRVEPARPVEPIYSRPRPRSLDFSQCTDPIATDYPALTHVQAQQAPCRRGQSPSHRTAHYRTPSIDTLAEAALAVSPEYGPKNSSDIYRRDHIYSQAYQARSTHGASEPPHKRSRSELLPSPQVERYTSRPATSYEAHTAHQGGYDSRVEEAALLLNFRTGGWPSNGNAMSPPRAPATAANRSHANSFPSQALRHAGNTEATAYSQLLSPFKLQQVQHSRPTLPSPEQTLEESYGGMVEDVELLTADAEPRVSGQARQLKQRAPQQTQTPPDEHTSRAHSVDGISNATSGSRRGWPKGKPRKAGNRKTVAEKAATKRAVARKRNLDGSKALGKANAPSATEATVARSNIPRRASICSAPLGLPETRAPNARPQSVPREVPMSIRGAPMTKAMKQQSKVKVDTVCAGCSIARESTIANSVMDEWISCNGCKKWFHIDCAGFKKAQEIKDVDKYFCAACESQHGKTTYVRKSTRAHASVDYAELQKGVLKTSEDSAEHHYIQPIKDGTFTFDPETFPRMRPELVTRDFLEKSGVFVEPICIPAEWNPRPWNEKRRTAPDDEDVEMSSSSEDASMTDLRPDEFEYDTVLDDGQDRLDMVMPEGLTVRHVCNLVGADTPLDVIDVKTQNSGAKMVLGRWADYYEQTGDDKPIRNVISLEVSQSKLGRLLRRPKVVRDIDLQDSVWPQEEKDKGKWPKVQYYCLMSVADSYTDFHIDFGGSSVYYHILKGKKTFFFIPPKPKHLKAYEEWNESPQQNFTFLPSITNECYRVDLSEGDTMLIPSGWIHAVWTPETSLVIGGNFLTKMSYRNQFRVVDIEKANHTPMKFRYPFFQRIMWYTAIQYLSLDPLPSEVSEQFNTGKKYVREVPIWQDFDGEIAANDGRPGAHNNRYYAQAELDGLPDLVNYIWRTVMTILGRVEGVSEDQKKRVNASIPKGYGEPQEIARTFALWACWKRGNEDPPAWAHPDFALDLIKEEGPAKKLSARAMKDLERKAAIDAWRTAPDRQSQRVMSKHVVVATTATSAANGASTHSPAPPSTTTSHSSEDHHLAHLSHQETPSYASPAALVMTSLPGHHFSTPKTSVLGPKRVACDTCRKRRIRCKHKDTVLQATPEAMPGLPVATSLQSQLAPELLDNITVTPRYGSGGQHEVHTSVYHLEDTPGLDGNGNGNGDMHIGDHGPQPGTNAYISANIPMTMNGVAIFGESLKRSRSKACFECRRSKRRCVHDDRGNVDPVKAAETPVPRGSVVKHRASEGDGSPLTVKRKSQDATSQVPNLEGGIAGVLIPQKVIHDKQPAQLTSRQKPPRIVHHAPDDEQQPEIDPNLFSYPEPTDEGAYTHHSYPYPEPEQQNSYVSEYPSLEQIASEVLDMNGQADEGDFIDRQLNALSYERLHGQHSSSPQDRHGAMSRTHGPTAKASDSVDSGVSFPHFDISGAAQDPERSLDDRLREALTADGTVTYEGLPALQTTTWSNGFGNGAPHSAVAGSESAEGFMPPANDDATALPLYQPPASLSESPEQVKRQPMTNGITKSSPHKRKRASFSTETMDSKRAKVDSVSVDR
ncbi:JmjC domain-containing histone demethylation protein 1 [Friedmanniomyces endolithicus]|uniref:JmjC domain-containing histone demethylation protein 1 n=1 Tax=Friedmanniomyces endolithicus TaxID=329885 RepID=A0AAN6F595_9PEZI|nr:JmjC domain-containing histone demethylation protein 1 [Friedmanniomyces endolithicus]